MDFTENNCPPGEHLLREAGSINYKCEKCGALGNFIFNEQTKKLEFKTTRQLAGLDK